MLENGTCACFFLFVAQGFAASANQQLNGTNNKPATFTTKPPIKLSFVQPKKKQKIQEKTDSFLDAKDEILEKDSNVEFQNCTFNGNIIINNYYNFKNTDNSK